MGTKQNILQCALDLLQRQGYLWSYEDISQQLGIKKASIHYHFPTKENLIAACSRHYIEGLKKKMEWIASTEESSKEKLRAFIDLYRLTFEKNYLCLCTMLSANYETSSSEIHVHLKDFFSFALSWLESILVEGQQSGEFKASLNPKEGSLVLLNFLQGLLLTERVLTEQAFGQKASYILHLLT